MTKSLRGYFKYMSTVGFGKVVCKNCHTDLSNGLAYVMMHHNNLYTTYTCYCGKCWATMEVVES